MKLFRPVGKFSESPSGSQLLARQAGQTVGKRWRFRRNLVIYIAHRNGFSQRILSDVFDLPRSRIASILREISVIANVMEPTAESDS